MIVAASLVGPGDHVWLPHKLAALSACVDRICLLADRCPQAAAIARRWPKAEVREAESDAADCAMGPDGPRWSEGRLRQMLWDWAGEAAPKWVLLSDADEMPTPAVADWMARADERVDVWYAHWVNLVFDAGHAIGGMRSPWSWRAPGSNKKGLLVRWRPGLRYRPGTRHVRMEPSPLNESRAVFDESHRIAPVKLLHYRWAAWPRWRASPSSRLAPYVPWPPPDAEVVAVPRHWRWHHEAETLLRSLPDPIAVVGNGPCIGQGQAIDAHATVIRFNNWRTAGEAAHAGSRTDLWVTNCWEDVVMREWTGAMLTVSTDAEQPARHDLWLGMYPHMAVPRTSWASDARALKPKPSSGLILLQRLARMGRRVDAYGFDGLRTGRHDHPREDRVLARLKGVRLW